MLALAAVTVTVFVLASSKKTTSSVSFSPPRAEIVSPLKTPGTTVKPKVQQHPYPECAECLAWMKERSGYPDEIEATWLERIQERTEDNRRHVVIKARVRGRNAAGSKEVQTLVFHFSDEEISAVNREF